jgi:hypothetical protein
VGAGKGRASSGPVDLGALQRDKGF